MASGALPPGFPAVAIDGRFYWDGGLVSNTPLMEVLSRPPRRDTLAFQVDLWSAKGPLPKNLLDVDEPPLLDADEQRIDGSLDKVGEALLAKPRGDVVAVRGTGGEHGEDDALEGALEHLGHLLTHVCLSSLPDVAANQCC